MKQGKRLTRNQRELLSRHGYDWQEWLFASEDDQAILIVHKTTKETEWVKKE